MQEIERPAQSDAERLLPGGAQSLNPSSSTSNLIPDVHHIQAAVQKQYPVIRVPTEDEDVKESGILVESRLLLHLWLLRWTT